MCNRISPWLLCLVLVIAMAGVTLAACGHRGPLYLPEDTKQDPAR